MGFGPDPAKLSSLTYSSTAHPASMGSRSRFNNSHFSNHRWSLGLLPVRPTRWEPARARPRSERSPGEARSCRHPSWKKQKKYIISWSLVVQLLPPLWLLIIDLPFYLAHFPNFRRPECQRGGVCANHGHRVAFVRAPLPSPYLDAGGSAKVCRHEDPHDADGECRHRPHHDDHQLAIRSGGLHKFEAGMEGLRKRGERREYLETWSMFPSLKKNR